MSDISAEEFLRLAVSARPASVERRGKLADLLAAQGKRAEALSLLREGLLFATGREDMLADLATAFIRLDAFPEALEALQAASRLCPTNQTIRAQLKSLAAQLKDGQTATRQLFNQYAADFEGELASLHYTAPQQIARMLAQYADRFAGGRVIDLGCGTGLMGPYLRSAATLVGVDLSPAMLEEAGKKNIYDALIAADVVQYFLQPQPKAALITAADVLVYIGDLQPLFHAVRTVLAKGGLFAFTVERQPGDGFSISETKRFSHSETYIRALADSVGLGVLCCEGIVPRHDRGKPVDGLMVLLELL